MILVRFLLISLAAYLLVRSFMKYGKDETAGQSGAEPDGKIKVPPKKISRSIGEYVDYEEIKNKKT